VLSYICRRNRNTNSTEGKEAVGGKNHFSGRGKNMKNKSDGRIIIYTTTSKKKQRGKTERKIEKYQPALWG